ncbi:hypothetical protein KAR91_27110 [Candidatus Pacearchaeota archaeon]|nr:hypothetical protein [Candidatus Pacearchaeota archaeon]
MTQKTEKIGITLVKKVLDGEVADDSYADGDDWLRIEQEPFPESEYSSFIEWMAAKGYSFNSPNLQTYSEEYRSETEQDCNEDGSLEITLNVYKSREDLPYTLNTSFGELTGKNVGGLTDRVKSVSVINTDKVDLGTLFTNFEGALWEGPTLNSDNEPVRPPDINVNDSDTGLIFGGASGSGESGGDGVTGTARIKYSEAVDIYTLTIIPRTGDDVDSEDVSTGYQSTVTATWEDGPTVHEVELPEMKDNCGKDSDNRSISDDPDADPDDPDGEQDTCVRHIKVYGRCTGKLLEDYLEPMACPDGIGGS